MGSKFLWIGLTMIVAIPPMVTGFGGHSESAIVIAGGVIMVVGAILYCLNK